VPKADLVLEGGGVKGIALVGAVAVLEEHGYEFNRIAGTSAGSIVGALLAAGMPASEMVEIMQSIDYTRFQDKASKRRFPGGKLYSLLTQQGIYEGRYLAKWLAELLEPRGVRTFNDLRYGEAGTALPPEQQFRLVVMASDVSTGRLRRLPWDYAALGREPGDVLVVDSVRASMSIPFFYEPVKLRNPTTLEDIWLVDGGLLSNFPVEIFDREHGNPPRWPTFGIKLSARRGSQAIQAKVDSTLDLARSIIMTMHSFYDQMHVDDPGVLARTIFVDTLGVKSTDFGLERETADRLYESGRSAAEAFLSTWDFDAYVEQFRIPSIPAEAGPPTTGRPGP
jgi:NTE family protein